MAPQPLPVDAQILATSQSSRTADSRPTDSDRRDAAPGATLPDPSGWLPLDAEVNRSRVLRIAAHLLSRVPLREVCLQDVADDADLPLAHVQQLYASILDVGAAVLDHERSVMAAIQSYIRDSGGPVVDQVVQTFRLVGEGLQRDVVMRAGVRLAQESKHAFPERRLEPTRTWDGFLEELLRQAHSEGQLRVDVDVSAEVPLLLREALQVRDELIARQHWSDAADLLEQVGRRRLTAMGHHRPQTTNPAEAGQQR